MTPTDDELKPCPCGQTPTRLMVLAESRNPKWADCAPDCCDEWRVEFRNGYDDIASEESYRKAVYAWNDATRGWGQDAQRP